MVEWEHGGTGARWHAAREHVSTGAREHGSTGAREFGSAGVRGTNHKRAAAVHFVFEELECIATTVTDVHNLPIGRPGLDSFEPKKALAILSLSFCGDRFLLVRHWTTVQNLVGQPEDFTMNRICNKRVVTQPALRRTVAKLASVRQGIMR